MSNKLYFDITIKNGYFQWIEVSSKKKEPLKLLQLIEKIIKEDIEWRNPPPNLNKKNLQLNDLRQKAITIRNSYLSEVKENGILSYAFSSESDTKNQVEETCQRINSLIVCLFVIPPEVFHTHIFPHLSLRDLLNCAQVSKAFYNLAQQALHTRAKNDYGFSLTTENSPVPYLHSLYRGMRNLVDAHPEVDIAPFVDTKPVWWGTCPPKIYFEPSFKMMKGLLATANVPGLNAQTIDNLNKAFILAAKNEEIDVIRLLLGCGMHPDSKNSGNETALLFAKPNIQVIQALLDKGANVNQINGEETPLWRYLEDAEITDLLCRKNAHVMHIKEGKTPLHETAAKGWKASAQILLKNHADPNGNDRNFNKPLHVAQADFDLIEILLNEGTDPNFPDREGVYPLCRFIKDPPILKLLCDKGAKIELCHALHLALKKDLKDSVEMLLKCKADVNSIDKAGLTPIFYAANRTMVYLLNTYHANINYQTQNQRRTPLHIAVTKKQEEIVLALLECGADITLKDSWEKGPADDPVNPFKEIFEMYQILSKLQPN